MFIQEGGWWRLSSDVTVRHAVEELHLGRCLLSSHSLSLSPSVTALTGLWWDDAECSQVIRRHHQLTAVGVVISNKRYIDDVMTTLAALPRLTSVILEVDDDDVTREVSKKLSDLRQMTEMWMIFHYSYSPSDDDVSTLARAVSDLDTLVMQGQLGRFDNASKFF